MGKINPPDESIWIDYRYGGETWDSLVLKLIGGSIYGSAATVYFDAVNRSVLTDTSALPDFLHEQAVIQETSLLSPQTVHQNGELSDFVAPVEKGSIFLPYGERWENGSAVFHNGTDIAAEEGSEIRAMADGTVAEVAENPEYGCYLVLQHKNSIQTLYAHCQKALVRAGDSVQAGKAVALVGHTGSAARTMVHLELRKNGQTLDPGALLRDFYS